MILRSYRDASIHPQGVIHNTKHGSSLSSLDDLLPAMKSQSDRERSRSKIVNGESGGVPSMIREKSVGSIGPKSKTRHVGSRSFALQDEDGQAGLSRSPPTPGDGESKRPKGQEHRKGILGAPGALGDDRRDSSISTDGSHSTDSGDSRLSRRSSTRLSPTLEDTETENLGKALQHVRRQVASLEKEKELVLLSRKLSELEAEEVAGFPTNTSDTGEEPFEDLRTRKICQESRLAVPVTKPYSGRNHAQYQGFVIACEHLFDTRPTTYGKDVQKVLYGIGLLDGTPSTTWYRYEERFGRLDMSWDAFKTFLLDDLCPPEIRLQDAHKKYREARQKPGQTVHALVRYLEGLETQMGPVTEEDQISIILRALHPWIEAQVSSRLESPRTKSKVVQLALKIESVSCFGPTERREDQANVRSSSRAWDPVDDFGGRRSAKRARPEDESAGLFFGSPASAKPRRRRS